MEEINFDNSNNDHNSLLMDGNKPANISPINISSDSNIGLDLLMNKDKPL